MVRADELRREAFEVSASAALSKAFSGSALRTLESQSQNLAIRHLRVEERIESRVLVFWDPLADEAVLQVITEQRAVSTDDPNPPWSGTVRQWWARLQSVAGSWKVVEQEDLPPDRWRPAVPGF